MVLIHPNIIMELGLPIFNLEQTENVDVAISFSKTGITQKKHSLKKYCKIRPFSPNSIFHLKLVHAVICPQLCMPLIFRLPFLEINDVICDHKWCACIVWDKKLNYNLLAPKKKLETPPPEKTLLEEVQQNKIYKKENLWELLEIFPKKWEDQLLEDIPDVQPNYITSILHRIQTLEIESSMENMENNLLKTFSKVFQPIPHVQYFTVPHIVHRTPADSGGRSADVRWTMTGLLGDDTPGTLNSNKDQRCSKARDVKSLSRQ